MDTPDKIIVTTFSKDGYFQYGKRMLESYRAPFPLVIYTEDPDHIHTDKGEVHNLMSVPDLREFLESCDPNGIEAGNLSSEATLTPEQQLISEKDRKKNYSYHFNAYKFCRVVFALWDAARQQRTGMLMRLDGDSIIRKPLPDDFFERFLPADAAYSFLGRGAGPYDYTEVSFLIFRLPEALPILEKWKNFYTSGEMYSYPIWHDAYLFDRAREQFPRIKGHNLTPGEHGGNVIHRCEVGKYIDQLLGSRRKSMGRSPESYHPWIQPFVRYWWINKNRVKRIFGHKKRTK